MKPSLGYFVALFGVASMAIASPPGWGGLEEVALASLPDLAVTARVQQAQPGAQVLTLGLEGGDLDRVQAIRYQVIAGKQEAVPVEVTEAGPGRRVRFRADVPLQVLPDTVLAEVDLEGEAAPVLVTGLKFAPREARTQFELHPVYRRAADREELVEVKLAWAPGDSEDGQRPTRLLFAIRHDRPYDEAPRSWFELGPEDRGEHRVMGLWARSGAKWFGIGDEDYQVWLVAEYADGLVENHAAWFPGALGPEVLPEDREAAKQPRKPAAMLRGRALHRDTP